MQFSDAFLRQVRDRVSIAEYAGRKLSWDRKSRPAAGDYWACCPFHQEKSPSFHVLESKGIYKCFGCGEKGDVFTLAMKLEGLNFPEAVAQIADRAGMALPVDEQEDRGEADRRKRLYLCVARAGKLYADALYAREGADARAYLKGRGIDGDVCKQFGIGYAPGGYTWLIEKLKAEGFTPGEILEAGLARDGERGPIDTFRDRVTFEIQDSGGKLVAFGARALKKDEKAKYINSPETPLYHKGRVLYRLKQAREMLARNKGEGLVVGEGYLDVIAFERAGIAAVAPCGTALTDDQLQLLWRSGGEPILCFDGDSAGLRAADRSLDIALPHLGPGRTIRIAVLPPGEDPDDVFRRAGPEALAPMIAAAIGAADALFQREQARKPLDTPEARAAFKANLRSAASRIADDDTKRLYLSELLSRADALMRPPPFQPYQQNQPRPPFVPGQGRRPAPPQEATPELKARAGSAARSPAEPFLRAAIDYPGVLARFGDWIDRLHIVDRDLEPIRAAIQTLSAQESPAPIDRGAVTRHLTQFGEERALARLLRWPKPRPHDAQAPGSGAGEIEAEWLALVTREVVLPAIKEEMAELRARADDGDDAAFAQFQALSREAREIEIRAREAKLDETAPDDLVA